MKAVQANFLEFLKSSPQFSIPIYQRTYSWGERECLQLWKDIIRTGSNDSISAHFIGSIVYIEKGLYQVSSQDPLMVIDGQQRLTTIMLILEALARILGDKEPMDGFSRKKIRHYYLLNPLEEGERSYKLLLTQTDKNTLLALLQQKDIPAAYSFRVKENFEFFINKINSLEDISTLCKGLSKLIVVDISLNRNEDNPQLIFESMNSTGRELSQADLIRNYILMGLEQNQQTQLYKDHWRPMEIEFGQKAYESHFDKFMRHYLTVKTGEIPNINRVYEAFKIYSQTNTIVSIGIEGLVKDIHTYASHYCRMVLGKETNKKLNEAFHDLKDFKVDVAYPFLLELYQDYFTDSLSLEDFHEILRLTESYVFRRAICNIPTNSLNKTFATFTKNLDKRNYLESVKANYLLQRSYRRFPEDEEFIRELKVRDLYNFPRRSFWLRRMENFNRKERVAVNEFSIEHIMPQKEDLTPSWKQELGPDWQRIHEKWLHTLGNLTLTGYNSEYSYKPFLEKRDMENGFKDSPIKLNENLRGIDRWNEEAIIDRAIKLSDLAKIVWGKPIMKDETLLDRQKNQEQESGYSISDHEYLSEDRAMRQVFDSLRKQILAIDPVVTEEFFKKYVAYKAETNFVDIVAQAKRLRLSLNMRFDEIDDPRGICKDVTNLGRWGNGDVEVGIDSEKDIPYIIGLIRQSFDKQMGNGGQE